MKRLAIILVCSIMLGANLLAGAKDIYIAQNDAGAANGTNSANAHGYVWFNNEANWNSSAGNIYAGDTVHLCGTITNYIVIRGSGTTGNPITILFEPNASLSQPAGILAYCQGNNIVIDGGVNGIIENTDNGTLLKYQSAVSGISASGTHDLEVKNLTFRNFYIHEGTNDGAAFDFDSNGALYMNGFGNNISVHNCIFSNICWVLNFQGGSGGGMNIYSNYFLNYDHGVAGLGYAYSNVNIFNNHFGSTANWDTYVDRWHHDGIHIFFDAGGTLSNVKIFNNLFDGKWGIDNTAHIYCEGDYTHANAAALSNFTFFNNIFIQYPGDILNNGSASGGGPNWAWYNNTFVGSGVANSLGLNVGRGTNVVVKNNLFTSLTTFINVMTNCVPSYNVYANAIAGGNSPWAMKGISYSTFTTWQTAVGDPNSFYTTNPVVNAGGSLSAVSPAAGVGANLSGIFTTDINGMTRSAPWDIGAYTRGLVAPPTGLQLLPSP